MLRSLYSGVAGMSTHQTKMDVIGNNISNVSTYGFKSTRVTFRDVYYQTSTDATAATAAKGGTNAVQVGYGASLGSTDVNHSQSTLTTTGLSLDVAIAGDGYFQVMDGTGNIFYTKAGMLDIDADGNLVDINGNYILGVSASGLTRGPSSEKIRIALPNEEPSTALAAETINGIIFSVESSEEAAAANVSVNFSSTSSLPIGQKVSAIVNSNSISIILNAKESFASMAELEQEINTAITTANGGKEFATGDLNISMDPADAWPGTLTGEQIVKSNFGVDSGEVILPAEMEDGFSISTVGDTFSVNKPIDFTINMDEANGICTITADGGRYSATISQSQMEKAGSVLMRSAEDTDCFTMTFPSWQNMLKHSGKTYTATEASVPTMPANNLGLGSVTFVMADGTEGGEQTVADLTGISIGSNGVITGTHPSFGIMELGRIDLATFDNPKGLTQTGNTYFSESANSGEPKLCIAGTGGSGDLAGGCLEASNVDLTNEMADMITTQRGFQACSRLITVSDTMLEELINLKR